MFVPYGLTEPRRLVLLKVKISHALILVKLKETFMNQFKNNIFSMFHNANKESENTVLEMPEVFDNLNPYIKITFDGQTVNILCIYFF